MSKWDKLLLRIRLLSKDITFEELAKVLIHYGYRQEQPGAGSSHYSFRKSGCSTITLPKHRPMGIVYIRMVRDVVEREENEQH